MNKVLLKKLTLCNSENINILDGSDIVLSVELKHLKMLSTV